MSGFALVMNRRLRRLTFEPELSNPFASKPNDKANENARLPAELQKAASILEMHLNPTSAFSFYRRNRRSSSFANSSTLRSRRGYPLPGSGRRQLRRLPFPGTFRRCLD
jgi:hypothetical protein